MTKSRKTLTIQQEQAIVAENKRRLGAGSDKSQTAPVQCAKEEPKLNTITNQATISRLLKNADWFSNSPVLRCVSFKKQRPAADYDLEDALNKRICHHTLH